MQPVTTFARRRTLAAATTVGLVAASLSLLVVGSQPASAAVSIDAPVTPLAGTVDLTGSVGVAPGEVTTVLYVFDATKSTASPDRTDCSGNGGVGLEDDLNGDGSTGDILDCEIAGVEALNSSLATTSGLQVGLVAFANDAAVADLDPVGTTTFLPPGYTGGDARPRISTVATSVVRDRIGLYDPTDLGGSGAGTAFNSAVSVALSTLATAPAGPKWVMFLSDGQSAIDDTLLGNLSRSGVRLRSFGIGADATCAPYGSLYKMASATGESCTVVADPASLTAGLTGSRPDAVSGVTVTIDHVAVAARVDAFGGWRAGFVLGAGTYTATVEAILASGATERAQRTFTVASAAGPAPATGSVTYAPGSLQATVIKVTPPKPTRAPLPPRVTGRVGRPVDDLTVAASLAGAQVQLQARAAAGDPWTTVGQNRTDRDGRFTVSWKPRARLHLLQVVLVPPTGFAGSAAAVPMAPISACKVTRRGGGWLVVCRTTARAGSVVRLLEKATTTDRARVRGGTFRLHGAGKVGTHRIDLAVSKRRHIRLAL